MSFPQFGFEFRAEACFVFQFCVGFNYLFFEREKLLVGLPLTLNSFTLAIVEKVLPPQNVPCHARDNSEQHGQKNHRDAASANGPEAPFCEFFFEQTVVFKAAR